MFSRYVLVIVSLLDFLSDFHVSCCDESCTNRTVFTPSSLVVKHGDPTSAICSLCPSCPDDIFNLEKSVGSHVNNGSTITWTVDKMMEWKMTPLCYYTEADGHQCCTPLNVTVYKSPDLVSVSFMNHSGPLFESRDYTLQCEVQNVAPVRSVHVTFFRGQTELGQKQYLSKPQKEPVTEVFTLSISTTKEDDGAQYWCQAKLELGPDGPQTPPMVVSKNVTATVYYKPQQLAPSRPDVITLTQGDPLELDCTAVGNPSPSYTWTSLPDGVPPSNSRVLTIQSVASGHEGQYTCSVSNDVGTNTVTFRVAVKPYIIPYIVVAAVVVFTGLIAVAIYFYKQGRMGQYNLKDVFPFHKQHEAVPTVE
ncbi:vascular cell adhesion protein 1-like [Hippoglossus hippoglossus]|uniref:vascular cell adhesion protein 1-like n=1 Tax=Hippoglossus hippoglossus TaxID=8267 RepID=UPI00148D39E0|nr:vascular cell adhesion protein 1-like [Hippoglossus hippoglossus]